MASKDDLFFQEVRVLQRRTRCSNFVCEEFIKAYRKFASTPVEKTIKEFDSDAKEAAGSRYIVLNGCPGCNRHVYLPTEKAMTCPFIKGDGNICGHPRFDVNKKPFEVSILCAWVLLAIVYAILILLNLFYLLCVYFIDYSLANILKFLLRAQRAFYFSIRERLKAFLLIPGFKDLLEHERLRPRGPENIMTDTYDSHAWKKYMGEPGYPCSRIGLQGCTDGFQAHVAGSLSMKPFMLANFSLPPALRFKTQFMFLLMLLPINVKGYGLKKYFDFAAKFELDSLYYTGESGIKVKIFSCSMDTPGRHELLGA